MIHLIAMFDTRRAMRRGGAAFCAFALLTLPVTAAPPKKTTPAHAAGGSGSATLPDPKNPAHWLLYSLHWRGLQVQESGSSNLLGTLEGVDATFYQKGIPTAALSAPVARADDSRNIVSASRRVRCRSLVERGTTLTADNMTWYEKLNKIVASGNVVYHNGKNGAIARTSVLVVDTALKKFYTNTPGSAVLPKGF